MSTRATRLEDIDMKIRNMTLITAACGALLAAAAPSVVHSADAAKPAHAAKAAAKAHTFATADEAAEALVKAARDKNVPELLGVVGADAKVWLYSGDAVADANDWEQFVAAYDAKHSLDTSTEGRAVLVVGDDDWPFPAPIVKRGDRWAFDTAAGREEILNRRVGRNELDTIQTLLAITDAQREYAASDPDGNGFPDYAKRISSTPGHKDGLYWPTHDNDPESPLGPLVAAASRQGYGKEGSPKPAPYHGYYYRLLTSQGSDAPGGAFDYMVGDKLLGGFAVVAWPATYGASGVMTFIVNHDGVVYQKDLGGQTAATATNMKQFNPDSSWSKSSS
jgi:hypothetical protein